MESANLQELRDYLSSLPPGKVPDCERLECLLVRCWDALHGSDVEGTTARKLIRRIENAEWNPPELSFTIERHGQTVFGSTRASLHHWTVDVGTGAADCDSRSSYRQIAPRARAVHVEPIARAIIAAVVAGRDAPPLKWLQKPNRVRVNLSNAVGASPTDYKQTIQGRTRRLRDQLITGMAEAGWRRVGNQGAVFEKPATDI